MDDNNDFDKEKTNEQEPRKLQMTNSWTITYEKTMKYKNQLKESFFNYEDEIENINIVKKDNKIQYCSIDLLLKKMCEDNSFNIDIYINSENSRTFNFINAFIYQCFGFISYEKLIEKLLEMYTFYKYYKYHNNKSNNKIKKKILILIFKITNYLFDHKNNNCSYFQFSDELINKIKKFFEDNNNNIKEIQSFLEYIKEKKINEDNNFYKNKNMDLDDNNELQFNNIIKPGFYATNSFKNYPHAEFEFNMLNYNAKDIALIISYISIKKYINLYNHLYELNPTIKNKNDKPHLFALSDFANKLTNFLFEESLSYDLLKDRKLIVEKIIEILKELKNLNNFNDLLAVYSALMSISNNLTKTFSQINTESSTIFKEITKFCFFQDNYRNIREKKNKCIDEGIFYIPYIGINTKHITFYDEAKKYIDHNGLVCIEKIIVNQKEIEEFKNELRLLIKRKNTIKINNSKDIKELKLVFYNLCPIDFNTLESLSQKLEPKFTLYKEPDNRKRKTNTDKYINSSQFLKIK